MDTSRTPADTDGPAEFGLSPGRPWTMPGWFTHVLKGDGGERWRISVAIPPGYDPDAGPLPTLYVLDPFGTFGTAAQVSATATTLAAGALRPHAVIGVGPDTDDLLEVLSLRSRDLTPLPDDSYPDPTSRHGNGGGEAFADLLMGRVIPALEQEYNVDSNDRGLAGWSLGGLFTAWTAVTRPRVFRRYLLVSPSLWWADAATLDPARIAAADLTGADIYAAVGEHEARPTAQWPPIPPGTPKELIARAATVDMVDDLRCFTDLLRASPTAPASLRSEVIADEHHATGWAAAYTRGIVALYGAR